MLKSGVPSTPGAATIHSVVYATTEAIVLFEPSLLLTNSAKLSRKELLYG